MGLIMSKINIERALEDAWKDFLSLNANINNEPISIRNWRDNSQELEQKLVIVHAKPAKNEIQGTPLYSVEIELVCMTYTADDTDCADVTDIYQSIFSVVRDTTVDNLTNHISSDIRVLGIEHIDGEDIGGENNYQSMTIKTNIHIQTT